MEITAPIAYPRPMPSPLLGADVDRCVHHIFEDQVVANPHNLAVHATDRTLTYAELNHEANCVAWAILERSGDSQEPVALLFEHGATMLAALLGALKAGKIYVPLDASFPLSRNRFALEDSTATAIVTNRANLALARQLAGEELAIVDVDAIGPTGHGADPGVQVKTTSVCSIYYTSGSTGRPKGSVRSHRVSVFCSLLEAAMLRIRTGDRLTLLKSLGFSGSVGDIYTALFSGASLHPYDLKQRGVGPLPEWMHKQAITIANMSPSVFRQFAPLIPSRQALPRLRLVRMGSEPLLTSDVALYKQMLPDSCILANQWGASETPCIWPFFMDKQTEVRERVPIGYAIEGVEVLLLDEHGALAPVGVVGEIAIRSCHVSNGYWGRPELTAQLFEADPNGGDARIYRTGDVGVMAQDGAVTLLGRRDFQVKIRGYRVELEEIEAALANLAQIREAAVVAHRQEDGDHLLAAYVVANDPAPAGAELRARLAEQLPDYMLPARFVFLSALPRTATGKVDRLALPLPDQARPAVDSELAAPRTPNEQKLVQIWASALKVDQVGIHDRFLDLGGHSLIAGAIAIRVIEEFGIDLSLQQLLENETVAQMAIAVTHAQVGRLDLSETEQFLRQLESQPDD